MRKGPFLRTVIVTCDMKPPVKMTSFQTIVQKKTFSLPPPVHCSPPQHLHPFIKRDFCPFAVRPPGFAEFRLIASRGHVELVLRQSMAKDHQGAAAVIRGDALQPPIGAPRPQSR